jgi:hypothetical protein
MRGVYPSTLTFTIKRVRGVGNLWITESVVTYDGKPSNTISITELRSDKAAYETIYVGEPWEPLARRAQWVDLIG